MSSFPFLLALGAYVLNFACFFVGGPVGGLGLNFACFFVGGHGFDFCVYVASWSHALQSEWPFITTIIITVF